MTDTLTGCESCKHYEIQQESWEICTSGKFTEYLDVTKGVMKPIREGYDPPCKWVNHGKCPHWEPVDG